MLEDENYIWVLTSSHSSTQGQASADRGLREITETIMSKGIKIPAENLKSSLESFFKVVLNLISDLPELKLPYSLDEIEICAEISAEGKIQLVGGLTAGAKGGITFKLKRSDSR